MCRAGLTLALVASLLAGPVGAADHLVTRADVAGRLQAARQARAEDLAAVQELLATPAASVAAARVGADAGLVRASVASLNAAELRDLAQRARALRSDPAAALDKDIHDLLVLFLIIAIVILVLQAVN